MSFVRFLFLAHRYLGIGLGVLLVVWCVSGIVMIYVAYPELDPKARVQGLRPIDARTAATWEGASLPADDARPRSFQIEMLGERPLLRLTGAGTQRPIDLANGAELEGIDEATALGVATAFARAHGIEGAPRLTGLREFDQWTVGRARNGRPYYHFALDDPAVTQLHVSRPSGQMVLSTTRFVRFWNWLGAIPHWLYFSQLRANPPLWTQVIIWTSLTGCVLTIIGIYLGIRQLRRRESTGKLASPYRGLWYWHHVPGLIFGLFALTWAFSGLLSMYPWGSFAGTDPTPALQRVQGETPNWGALRGALPAILANLPAETVTLQSAPWNGQLFVVATTRDGTQHRLDSSGTPAPLGDADYAFAAGAIGGEWQLLRGEDSYYYGRSNDPPPLPVVRIATSGPEAAMFYLDAVSGRLVWYADADARLHRWLFNGLHSLDFTAFFRWRPFWDVLMVGLLLGATVVCATGTWLGVRRLLGRSRGAGFLVDLPRRRKREA